MPEVASARFKVFRYTLHAVAKKKKKTSRDAERVRKDTKF